MIMNNPSHGDYEIYDIGGNAILAAYSLGQVPSLDVRRTRHVSGRRQQRHAAAQPSTGRSTPITSAATRLLVRPGGDSRHQLELCRHRRLRRPKRLSELLLRNSSSSLSSCIRWPAAVCSPEARWPPFGNNFSVKGFGYFSESATTQMMMEGNSGAPAWGSSNSTPITPTRLRLRRSMSAWSAPI